MEMYDSGIIYQECFNLATKVQLILKDSNNLKLKYNEKMYSIASMLALGFNRFLKFMKFACLHQCCLSDKGVPEGLPLQIKLVGDFKLESMNEALAQTFHHCMSLRSGVARISPLLAMPCTLDSFQLVLCIPQPQKLALCCYQGR